MIDIGASNTAVTGVHDGLLLKKGTVVFGSAEIPRAQGTDSIPASTHSNIAGHFVSDQIRLQFSQSQPQVPLTPHYLVASKTPVDAGASAQATYRSFAGPPSTSFRRLHEERVLSEFKESVVQVWDPQRHMGQSLANSQEYLRSSEPGRPFEMPDGWNNVFGTERYRVAEGLFDDKAALTVCFFRASKKR